MLTAKGFEILLRAYDHFREEHLKIKSKNTENEVERDFLDNVVCQLGLPGPIFRELRVEIKTIR